MILKAAGGAGVSGELRCVRSHDSARQTETGLKIKLFCVKLQSDL